MGNREAATKELLGFIDAFAPTSPNRDLQEKRLKAMSDDEFDAFMRRLAEKKEKLVLYIPINAPYRLSKEVLLEISDKMGYDFEQHLILTDSDTGVTYRTPIKHMVYELPLRLQVQLRQKKTSIPTSNNVIDERSGQVAHESKGSSISYPEVQVIVGRGLDNTATEFLKLRAGDEVASNIIEHSIATTGRASMSSLNNVNSHVKAIDTMVAYLMGMHLKSTL